MHYAMDAFIGVDVRRHSFLTSALDGGERSDSRSSSYDIGTQCYEAVWAINILFGS
jgi:hypothetical protein